MAPVTQALQSEGLCLHTVQLLSIRAAYEHNSHLKLKMLLPWKSSLVFSKVADTLLLIWAEQSSQKHSERI